LDRIEYPVGSKAPGLLSWLAGGQLALMMALSALVLRQILHLGGVEPVQSVHLLQLSLLAMGVGLLLQLPGRWGLGSGLVLPSVFSVVFLRASLHALDRGGLPLLAGMMVVAAAVQLLIAQFRDRLRRFAPPIIAAVILLVVGFDAGLTGVQSMFALAGPRVLTAEGMFHHAVPGLFTLGVAVAITVWAKGRRAAFATTIGVLSGIVLAEWIQPSAFAELTRALSQSPIGVPSMQWEGFSFDRNLLIDFIVAAIASSLATVTALRDAYAINYPDQILHNGAVERGALHAEGLSNALCALLGISGLSGSPVRVGVCQALGIGTRTVGLVAAGVLCLLAFFPVIGRLLLAVPSSVVGAVFLVIGSTLIAQGFKRVASIRLDIRRGVLLSLSLVAALSVLLFPNYAASLPASLRPFFGTMLGASVTVAVALNLIFRLKGTRQLTVAIETLQWTQAIHNLEQTLDDWQVSMPLIERVRSDLHTVQPVLASASAQMVVLDLSADDASLGLRLYYSGSPPTLPGSWQADHVSVETVGARQRIALDYQV
jgi:xanthine permease XanP